MALSTEDFIIRAKNTHGGKYDYSKVVYEHSHKPVIIICPKHGEFSQPAMSHVNGRGCKKCGMKRGALLRTDTTESYIIKARLVYGKKYDYSKVVYSSSHNKVDIICPVHGMFTVTANTHLSGRGCKECGDIKHRGRTTLLSCSDEVRVSKTQRFVKKAIAIHDDKYDYSKSSYTYSTESVIIICRIHGEFLQTPASHINARAGCPECGTIARLNKLSSRTSRKYKVKHTTQPAVKTAIWVRLMNNLRKLFMNK